MTNTRDPRQPEPSTHQPIPASRLRLRPRGQRPKGTADRFEVSGNPARDVIEAIVSLAEARANWEECRVRLGGLLHEHDGLAVPTGADRLPRPYVGPWILPQHDTILAALTERDLPTGSREQLSVAASKFAGDWQRLLAENRSRRDIGGTRMAEAS